MARIRSIHPSLSTDDAYLAFTMPAKAAWPLLWTLCDDQGLFEWKPLRLKARIFPADNIDFEAVLAEWVSHNAIQRIEIDGRPYGIVRNFCKWQHPRKPTCFVPVPHQYRTYVSLNAAIAELMLNQSGKSSPEEEKRRRGGSEERKKEAFHEEDSLGSIHRGRVVPHPATRGGR